MLNSTVISPALSSSHTFYARIAWRVLAEIKGLDNYEVLV